MVQVMKQIHYCFMKHNRKGIAVSVKFKLIYDYLYPMLLHSPLDEYGVLYNNSGSVQVNNYNINLNRSQAVYFL